MTQSVRILIGRHVPGFVLALLVVFALVGLTALLWGAVTLVRRKSPSVVRANGILAANLVMAPLLLELFVRVGIALDVPALQRPELYANAYVDEDYYKLAHAWRLERGEPIRTVGLSPLGHDDELGWAYERTPRNPLGALTDRAYDLSRPSVLFLGNSFVAHGKTMEDKLPQQLDRLADDFAVHNLGVGGYGLDQIYLRYRRVSRELPESRLIVGIFAADIDRCILRFRNRPKPWFEVDKGELVLRGVPVEADLDRYLEENPPSFRSYAVASISRAVEYLIAGGSYNVQTRRREKEVLASLLVDRIVREAKSGDRDLLFVIFVPRDGGGWRKHHLMTELDRLEAQVVDTEAILRDRLGHGERFSDFYDETHHLGPRANAIIAEHIARSWL